MQGNALGGTRAAAHAVFFALVVTVLGLTAGSARAVAPVLNSVELPLYQNHPTFHWSLPAGDKGVIWSDHLVTATSSDVNLNNDGEFLQQNWLTFNVLGHTATSYADLREYKPGTYFVHIAGHDPACTANSCAIEFSNILSFTVVAPSSGGGGGGGGGGGDKVAPLETLSFAAVQDIDKLSVTARSSESGVVSATGTVSTPGASKAYRFKRAARSVGANVKVKLRLKLAKKKLRAVKRALKKRKRIKAKITITVADKAGNKRSQKISIRLTN